LICTTTIDEPKEPVPYAVTCGKTRFNEYDVTNALNTGCYYWKKNSKIAGTEFPKLFNNNRFDFGEIKGPFYEFPLIDSAAYVSGMFLVPFPFSLSYFSLFGDLVEMDKVIIR
jgi:hypothetical protein